MWILNIFLKMLNWLLLPLSHNLTVFSCTKNMFFSKKENQEIKNVLFLNCISYLECFAFCIYSYETKRISYVVSIYSLRINVFWISYFFVGNCAFGIFRLNPILRVFCSHLFWYHQSYYIVLTSVSYKTTALLDSCCTYLYNIVIN